MKTCTKCGESGESRKGHRQCHACELAYSKEYNARPEVQAAAEDYREAYTAKCKEAA